MPVMVVMVVMVGLRLRCTAVMDVDMVIVASHIHLNFVVLPAALVDVNIVAYTAYDDLVVFVEAVVVMVVRCRCAGKYVPE